MSDFIDDWHKGVHDWADALGLDGDEREEYVAYHMEKAGYKRATTWTPPEPEGDDKGSGSMFSKRKTGAPGTKSRQPGPPAGDKYFRKG